MRSKFHIQVCFWLKMDEWDDFTCFYCLSAQVVCCYHSSPCKNLVVSGLERQLQAGTAGSPSGLAVPSDKYLSTRHRRCGCKLPCFSIAFGGVSRYARGSPPNVKSWFFSWVDFQEPGLIVQKKRFFQYRQ